MIPCYCWDRDRVASCPQTIPVFPPLMMLRVRVFPNLQFKFVSFGPLLVGSMHRLFCSFPNRLHVSLLPYSSFYFLKSTKKSLFLKKTVQYTMPLGCVIVRHDKQHIAFSLLFCSLFKIKKENKNYKSGFFPFQRSILRLRFSWNKFVIENLQPHLKIQYLFKEECWKGTFSPFKKFF